MRQKLMRVLKTAGAILLVLAVLGALFILLCEWPVYQEI